MPSVRMIDETTLGGRFEAPALELESGRLAVRDLISLRVRAEIRRYNNDRKATFYGLVQPADIKSLIDGPSKRSFRPIDADKQVDVALKAFREQRFVVLLPDRQAEDLDEVITLGEGDEVSFLRLVPLVGG